MLDKSRSALRAEYHSLFRRFVAHRQFHEMAARQGVDAADLCQSEMMIDAMFQAMRQCVRCTEKDACRLWMELTSPYEPYPGFCPIAVFLASCRGDASAAPAVAERESGAPAV